ncbi:MAG TPA: aspartyl protease [Candidatus Binatia bacterium]|nr:aspartyl protease [Candidatus Binatia bacterium]
MAVKVQFLIDTGAVYSLLPEAAWKNLRLKPMRTIDFVLADKTLVRREVAEARFEIKGEYATSPVILGAPGDAPLLGAVTLETLGLMVSPVSRKVLPMRMVLAPESVVPKEVRGRRPSGGRVLPFLPQSIVLPEPAGV